MVSRRDSTVIPDKCRSGASRTRTQNIAGDVCRAIRSRRLRATTRRFLASALTTAGEEGAASGQALLAAGGQILLAAHKRSGSVPHGVDQYLPMAERVQKRLPDVVVRVAGLQDVSKLADLRRRWTDEPHSHSLDESFDDRFARWLAKESEVRTFWLAEAGPDPVGMVNLLTFDRMPRPRVGASRWGYLGNMFVVEGWRGSGAAQLLLGAVIADAESRQLERIVLSPSARSVSFWSRAGFREADELLVYKPRPG